MYSSCSGVERERKDAKPKRVGWIEGGWQVGGGGFAGPTDTGGLGSQPQMNWRG